VPSRPGAGAEVPHPDEAGAKCMTKSAPMIGCWCRLSGRGGAVLSVPIGEVVVARVIPGRGKIYCCTYTKSPKTGKLDKVETSVVLVKQLSLDEVEGIKRTLE
jgi:hypothetical protein